jgi:hypothetical protein
VPSSAAARLSHPGPWTRARVADGLAKLVLLGWFVGSSILGASLLAPHVAGLPVPSAGDPRVGALVRATLGPDDRGRWVAIHLLLAGCDCSRRILAVLRARPPQPTARERVVWVGGAADPGLRALGYDIESIGPRELSARYGVEAAPTLLIVDPRGDLRYAGGYTAHRRGPEVLDREILTALIAEPMPAPASTPLPVLGCPASASLRARVDPLGLRPGPTSFEARASSPAMGTP